MLKLRIALRARLVIFAFLIEPSDRKPGTAGTGLSCLGVETSDKRVVLREYRAGALEVILVGALECPSTGADTCCE